MSAPTLAFSKAYTTKQRAVAMSRYAAVVSLFLDRPDASQIVNGAIMVAMARHGLLTGHRRRELTDKGRAWRAAYDGPVAPVETVTARGAPPVRKPAPAKAPSILAIMYAHPELWLFIHRPALDKLRPTPFWLLTWMSANTTVRTVDAIAAAVGWSAEAVAIALRAIRDAGYTVDIVGESAAD